MPIQRRSWGLLLALLVAACGGSASAQVLYVDADAVPGGDGLSWATAFTTIDDALDTAIAGTDIRVAEGTYMPDVAGLGDARTATYALLETVTLEGGYPGADAPDPDARDVTANPTVLSGDVGTGGDPADNCYHVVLAEGVGPTAVIDGFTITDGLANGDFTLERSEGAGMLNTGGASATVVACTFVGNTAVTGGGGLAIISGSPSVMSCTFDDNSGFEGGAIRIRSVDGASLGGCLLSGNSAQYGGGLAVIAGASVTVVDCVFQDNTATRMGKPAAATGGGMRAFFANATLVNCVFDGNSAEFGGGLAVTDVASVTATNCSFSLNTGTGGAVDAALVGVATLRNCIVWLNDEEALTTSAFGIIDASYCLIEGGWPSGEAIIDADPLFVNAAGGDLHLMAGSPAIDAGSNPAVPAPIVTDLDGEPRFMDVPEVPDCPQAPGTCGAPPIVDMGVYEFPGKVASCVGDTNDDGEVNVDDLNNVILDWGTDGSANGGDITGPIPGSPPDGIVNVNDLNAVIVGWGPCP